jgi:hypothetical protein
LDTEAAVEDVDLRSSANLASWSKTSDSVVFARLLPVFCVPASAACDEVAADAGGAEGARVAVTVGVDVVGLAELGRLVQASSSKLFGDRVELVLGGGWTGADEEDAIWGEVVRCIWSDAVEIAPRSTDDGGRLLLGCGLPRR